MLKQYYKENKTAIKKSVFFRKQPGKQIYRAVHPTDAQKIHKPGRNPKKHNSTYVPPFLCNISDRRGRRCKLRAADFRTQLHQNDTNLYPHRSKETGRDPERTTSTEQNEHSRSGIEENYFKSPLSMLNFI